MSPHIVIGYHDGQSWLGPVNLSQSAAVSLLPKIAVMQDTAIIAWTEQVNDSVYMVRYTRVHWSEFTGFPEVANGDGTQSTTGMIEVFKPQFDVYPNPTNGSVTMRYVLPEAMDVRVSVFDVSGRLVRRFDMGEEPMGAHRIVWDGTDSRSCRLGQGVYFLLLETPEWKFRKKLVLMR